MSEITYLATVEALRLFGVWSPGVPNQERIYLRANRDLNLGEYFLTTGIRIDDNTALPMTTDVLWLGTTQVATGYWIVVYTGPGQPKVTRMPNGEPALVLHWQKPTTLFAPDWVVPVLLHVSAVQVGKQARPS